MLGRGKLTLLDLLNTSQIENPTEVNLQKTSETFVLMRQGAPHSHSAKYCSKRCDPAYRTTRANKAGAVGSHRPSSHDMKILWGKWSLYPSTDVALWRAGSCLFACSTIQLQQLATPCSSLTAPERFHQLVTLTNTKC